MSAKSSTSLVKTSVWRTLLGVLAVAGLVTSVANALDAGEVPPPIDRPDRDGVAVDLDALRGRVVVVDFWASWCGPCRDEMPFLESMHRKYGEQGLVIVGVNIDRQRKKMEGFLRRHPVTFRIVHDADAEVAVRYQPPGMPTSYFIGRDGLLRHTHAGYSKGDDEAIEARIVALLAEPHQRDEARGAP